MNDQIKAVALQAESTNVKVSSDVIALAFAALMGVGLIFVAGFVHASTVHDVAHDQRHALAFPCH